MVRREPCCLSAWIIGFLLCRHRSNIILPSALYDGIIKSVLREERSVCFSSSGLSRDRNERGFLSMLIRKKCVLRIVVCLIAAVLLLAGSSDAATSRVTTNVDSGPGSLRQAVLDANKTPGEADEIQIDAGVGVITLASEINISDSLIIKGGGVTVKGSSTRLFGVTRGMVGFDSITFTGGKSFSGNGGAVNIEGAAKADFVNCTFFNNDAGSRGGAVCVASTQPDATTFLN